MSINLELDEDDEEYPERETRWEGYSDYQTVSKEVAASIEAAVQAYARIDSAHQESAKVTPEQAAEARARILSAAMSLIPEMREDRESVDFYDEVLARWQGDSGSISKLSETQLSEESPAWLFQMVLDLRTVGWKIGYLKAGRSREVNDDDPVESETDSMLKE